MPVAGVRVELVLDGSGEMRRYQTVSDADGLLSFPRVVDGTFDVTADKDGYGAVEMVRGLRVDGAPVDDLEVVLRRGAVVAGRLLGLAFEELARVVIDPEVERVSQDLEFGRGITLSGSVTFRSLPGSEARPSCSRRAVITGRIAAIRSSRLVRLHVGGSSTGRDQAGRAGPKARKRTLAVGASAVLTWAMPLRGRGATPKGRSCPWGEVMNNVIPDGSQSP